MGKSPKTNTSRTTPSTKRQSIGKVARASRRDAASAKTDAQVRTGTKQATVIALLRRQGGATIAELQKATGWQAHSLRGAISGTLKKKLALPVTSDVLEGRGRVYRIARHG